MRYQYLAVAIALAATAVSSEAIAQSASNQPASGGGDNASGVETIVVTAQKRSENLQNVPITVSAYSAQQLKQWNVTSVENLSTLVSGFTGAGLEDEQSPHIRGVGMQSSEPGQERAVATYVDGVYIGADSPGLMELPDLDTRNVEVLKGPQGTLFGRNTTAGLIQITTRDPELSGFQEEAEAGIANYDTVSGSAYFNAPVSSNVATNLFVQASSQGEGWGKNIQTGLSTYRDDADVVARNKWLVDFGSSTSFMLNADYEHTNRFGFYGLLQFPGTKNSLGQISTVTGWDINNPPKDNEVDTASGAGVSGELTHEFGFATLKDIVGYRTSQYAEYDGNAAVLPEDVLSFDRITQHTQLTEELQLSSPDNSPLVWTVGYFFYDATDQTNFPLFFGPAAGSTTVSSTTLSHIDTESNALYGQASYEILPGTTLTGGWRYSIDNHNLLPSTINTIKTSGPLPLGVYTGSYTETPDANRAAIEHKFSDDAMVYFSYNYGTKSGDYTPSKPNVAPSADERLHAYEVGTKLTGFADKLRLNVSGFYYDYANMQVTAYANGAAFIYNAAGSELYGSDIDLEFLPLKNLTLYSSMEFLHTQFTSFANAQVPVAQLAGGYVNTLENITGAPLLHSPTFTGSLGFNYVMQESYGNWVLAGSAYYNDGYWGDYGHITRQAAYTYVNASIEFATPDDRYYARLWGANLADAQVVDAIGVTAPYAAFRDLTAPRTFGVTLGARFD